MSIQTPVEPAAQHKRGKQRSRRDGDVTGPARVGRRTKSLVSSIKRGDVVIIDHADLDRLAAQDLAARRPAVVLNASRSITGRYPNGGPSVLLDAGIMLIDAIVGDAVLDIQSGQQLTIRGAEIWRGDALIATGTVQTRSSIERQLLAARTNIDTALEEFAANTLEYIHRERQLVLESPEMPELDTKLLNRQALVVVRGVGYRDDLAHLRGYIRELRPVLIGVDGGADAMIEEGLKPDVIIGDFDSISDSALACGAELIVHAYPDGSAPGAQRLDELGLAYKTFALAGTSEDAALLLAYEKGVELIVAVGTHASMADFLDKGRSGMASTFLTRLKVGPLLVDAKGVSRLYKHRIRKRDLSMFLIAVIACFVVLVVVAYPLRVFLDAGWLILRRG
jgi:uncharacterized membrane-anchored protein